MDTRPEQPPEGRLIHDAADRLDLSIREAAKRAGISYGRWRQIVKGYQNVSPGSYAPVHAPAKTLAKMAVVVGVTAEQMETDGQRPDAAEAMRQQAASRPAEPPAPLRVSAKLETGMQPHLDAVNARIGEVASRGTPVEQLTGKDLFPDLPWDEANWDQLRGFGYPVSQVAQFIAIMRADDAGTARNHQGSAAGLPAPSHIPATIRA